MAKEVNIELFEGEDVTIQLTVKDTAGVVVNVTGWTTSLAIGRRNDDSAALVTVSGTIIDAANGRIDFVLTDTDTNKLTRGTLDYDAKRTNDGNETVLAWGQIKVLGSVAA